MKKNNFTEFEIGDRVAIKGEYRTAYIGSEKKKPIEIQYRTPKFGIICGAAHKCLGTRKWDSYTHDDYGEHPYLEVEEVVMVWQVKLGLLNKPLNCLPHQLERTVLNFKIPVRFYFKKL